MLLRTAECPKIKNRFGAENMCEWLEICENIWLVSPTHCCSHHHPPPSHAASRSHTPHHPIIREGVAPVLYTHSLSAWLTWSCVCNQYTRTTLYTAHPYTHTHTHTHTHTTSTTTTTTTSSVLYAIIIFMICFS